MGNVQLFFKENRKAKKNEFYAASDQFVDENGKPLEWELRPVPTRRLEEIKWNAVKGGALDQRRYTTDLILEAVKFPPLRDKALQDSYGVKKQEDLLYELLRGNEVDNLLLKVMEMNGLTESVEELAGEAKN